MRHATARFVPAFVVSLLALVIAALVTTPGASASARQARKAQPESEEQRGACQARPLPPPPIDTSEEPPPGSPSPEPLPIPDDPVGGPRMGDCGIVQPDGAPNPPGGINAATWVIADLESGDVLAAKDPHARERPASLVKNLLAIVVIRELRPETKVAGTQEDADQEGTKVGIGPGGQYTVDQLLHALIMRSGNDAAWALARALGGVDVALQKMNAVAAELGALDTRAATPSGLDGPGMTTSAYDQSLIFRAAMKYEEFAKAATTPSIQFPGYAGRGGFQIDNDNDLLGSYEGFLGGKTGFTDDSRHTYVGAAERDGRRLAVVLLRGERNPDPLSEQGRKLLDYGFTLAGSGARPVGQLVDKAPEVQPKQDPSPDDARQQATEQVTKPVEQAAAESTPQADAERSAFGNVGLPLVVLAGVAVLVTAGMWLRRRRARIARANRAAAG
ncbi:D-alanyl-D-alanine carboxypeptidase family protein [Actinophytocola xanthii]|uniref:Peptidase M15 n=1 Tax=Actinophytocola xanthii TaxID=1912961 RepID=A0A1Q8CGX9_9PSEU|nr:D-alanyl-D-alanine carboxypeptidase family protein [Actinophytocola xanthii]OLF13570.1 peptidase M15 [Actinophytocola xanthii]